MAIGLSKDRTEKLWVAVDFARRLREGDSINAVLAITVERASRVGGVLTWSDVTEQVPIAGQEVAGTQVQLLLDDPPGPDEQPAGDYRVVVEISTAQGEELTGRAPLRIEG